MPAKESRKAKGRPFPWMCPSCQTRTVVPTSIDYSTTVKHDGSAYEVQLPNVEAPRCTSCGETIITVAVDEKINDALRAQLRLLTPAQIRRGIEQVGLRQQELAERLGVAPETISRWLNGFLIQSRAMDNLLRLYFALPAVRAALQGENQDPKLGTRIDRKATKATPSRKGSHVPRKSRSATR